MILPLKLVFSGSLFSYTLETIETNDAVKVRLIGSFIGSIKNDFVWKQMTQESPQYAMALKLSPWKTQWIA